MLAHYLKVIALSLLCAACASFDSADKKVLQAELLIESAEKAYQSGSYSDAEKLYEKAQELSPNSAQIAYRLGGLAFRKRELDVAATHFEKVIRLNPRDSKAHFNLATIRLIQAESHFKYYVATVDPKADIGKVSQLLGAIGDFAATNSKP